MRQMDESAPVTLADYALRFSLEDDFAASRAREAGLESGGRSRVGSGFRNYRNRKDAMRRGGAVRAAQRVAARAAA